MSLHRPNGCSSTFERSASAKKSQRPRSDELRDLLSALLV
jgi:hypothetical protein